jgi:hypothetical protein
VHHGADRPVTGPGEQLDDICYLGGFHQRQQRLPVVCSRVLGHHHSECGVRITVQCGSTAGGVPIMPDSSLRPSGWVRGDKGNALRSLYTRETSITSCGPSSGTLVIGTPCFPAQPPLLCSIVNSAPPSVHVCLYALLLTVRPRSPQPRVMATSPPAVPLSR